MMKKFDEKVMMKKVLDLKGNDEKKFFAKTSTKKVRKNEEIFGLHFSYENLET